MNQDLTKGSIIKSMLLFAIPMILGDLLQQSDESAGASPWRNHGDGAFSGFL